MALTQWVIFGFVGLVVYKFFNLFKNIKDARSTGLPYVVVPVLETEVIGKVLTPFFRKLNHDRFFEGKTWPNWIRFTMLDWAWEDKRQAHSTIGETFLVVSPEGIICYSADADLGWDVMQRRTEFTKPRDKYKMLEPYGPNVVTTEGKEYNFHLRMTAPTFSDHSGANDLVWKESEFQTRRLIDAWNKDGHTRDLAMDINGLTLAVISLTGFGKRIDFAADGSSELGNTVPKGYRLSFLSAIHSVTTYIVKILIFPKWFMNMTSMAPIALAHGELEKYLREMIRAETDKLHNGEIADDATKGNLLTSLLQNSAAEGAAQGKGRKQAFSEDEVLGNLFLYLLAGYETTANEITYGLITLALDLAMQERLMAEIDKVYAEAAAQGRSELTYTDDFEKLETCYGFMYEIFRLFPVALIVTKMCHSASTVTAHPEGAPPRKHVLPADCRVYLNCTAVHYNERYWPEPKAIKPERWMGDNVDKAHDGSEKKVVAADRTRQTKGTLLTFSGGGRACLGRKFAQSEYIAVLATLLRDYRVVLGEGMKPETVQREIDTLSSGGITLSPLHNVKLSLQKRERA